MNKLEQAAQQALKALIDSDDGGGLRYTEVQAVAALREALAEQAEHEPVCIDWDTKTDEPIMGYAAPVRTKDLTDDEINDVMEPNMSLFEFARAVIQEFRRKNGTA